jgi:hypothetical protein
MRLIHERFEKINKEDDIRLIYERFEKINKEVKDLRTE